MCIRDRAKYNQLLRIEEELCDLAVYGYKLSLIHILFYQPKKILREFPYRQDVNHETTNGRHIPVSFLPDILHAHLLNEDSERNVAQLILTVFSDGVQNIWEKRNRNMPDVCCLMIYILPIWKFPENLLGLVKHCWN